MRLSGGPLSQFTFEATNACNLTCLHCLRDKSGARHDLDLRLVDRLLSEGRPLGLHAASLTGGEPTIHPKFDDLLDLLGRHEIAFTFVTNGWNFLEVYPKLARYQERRLLAPIMFSLDGATPETHDAIRRPGSFRRVMQAVSACHAREIEFTFQLIVNRLNLPELERFGLMGALLGAKALFYGLILPTPQALDADLVPAPDDVRRARDTVARLAHALSCEVHSTPTFARARPEMDCPALRRSVLNVDCRGRLTFCCHLSGLVGASDEDQDIIADLNETPLEVALERLTDRIAEFHKARLRDLAQGSLGPTDDFPCQYCQRKFGKLGWMAGYPTSPWTPPAAS